MTEGSLPLSAFSKRPRYFVGNAYITAVFEVVQCEHNNFNLDYTTGYSVSRIMKQTSYFITNHHSRFNPMLQDELTNPLCASASVDQSRVKNQKGNSFEIGTHVYCDEIGTPQNPSLRDRLRTHNEVQHLWPGPMHPPTTSRHR
jgi:hypothetical protein